MLQRVSTVVVDRYGQDWRCTRAVGHLAKTTREHVSGHHRRHGHELFRAAGEEGMQ